jgi:YD repeat-containing protein
MLRAALCLLLLPTTALAQASPRRAFTDMAARIDAYVQPLVEDAQLSGTILVGRADEIVYERSFGAADMELAVPNAPETRFCVSSLTRPMTALLALQLIEDKKLSRADSVARFLPDFPRGSEITVAHLLDDTSGLPPRVTSDDEETVARSASDMVQLTGRHALLFAPGTRQSESAPGYAVLARVLEVAAGQGYGDLLRQRLFDVAGMSHSAHATARDVLPGRASPYLPWPGGTVRPAPLKDLSFLVGAGSVVSTPRDLFHLVRALRAGKFGAAGREYLRGRATLSWNGQTNGFRAFLEDDGRLTVVVASNLATGALERLRKDLPRLARGARLPPPPRLRLTPFVMARDELERHAGRYAGSGITFEAQAHPDGLLVAGDRVLVPVAERRFFCLTDYGSVVAVVAPDGRTAAMDWTAAGRTIRLERLP